MEKKKTNILTIFQNRNDQNGLKLKIQNLIVIFLFSFFELYCIEFLNLIVRSLTLHKSIVTWRK